MPYVSRVESTLVSFKIRDLTVVDVLKLLECLNSEIERLESGLSIMSVA